MSSSVRAARCCVASGRGQVSGSARIALRDTGSLDGGAANLSFVTPVFLVGASADQSVTTIGTISLSGSGTAAPVQTGEIGGTLALTGASIALTNQAAIQATAGGVTLTATSGDITMGAGAEIQANGFVSTFSMSRGWWAGARCNSPPSMVRSISTMPPPSMSPRRRDSPAMPGASA